MQKAESVETPRRDETVLHARQVKVVLNPPLPGKVENEAKQDDNWRAAQLEEPERWDGMS